MNDINTIMTIVNTFESLEKDDLIKDILCKMDERTITDILFRLQNNLPLLED